MKCRGCGGDTRDFIAKTVWAGPIADAPGPMHWQCEVDRLRLLLTEQHDLECIANRQLEEALSDGPWKWLERNYATIHCNWTSPGDWTVTTCYEDARDKNAYSRSTPLGAVLAAMNHEEPDDDEVELVDG